MAARYGLRFAALGYLAVLLVAPVGLVFWRTFEHGFSPAWHAVTTHDARHAFWLTILIALIAVPANTVFGVALALAIVRRRFPGKGLVNAVVDLPLARCLGEFGAVSVVSGHLVGRTETATLYVQDQFEGFDLTGAYAASVLLALIAIATLVAMNAFRPKEETR